MRKALFFVLSLCFCTFLISACSSSNQKSSDTALERQAASIEPVDVSKALYHNPDSLLYYAERAYLHDDPKGLFVTGAAAYLRAQDPNFPDSCTTVPLDEARVMLQHASDLGHPDAARLIHCLQSGGCWDSSNPETK